MHKKWRRMLVKQQLDLKNNEQALSKEKIEKKDDNRITIRRRKRLKNKAIR